MVLHPDDVMAISQIISAEKVLQSLEQMGPVMIFIMILSGIVCFLYAMFLIAYIINDWMKETSKLSIYNEMFERKMIRGNQMDSMKIKEAVDNMIVNSARKRDKSFLNRFFVSISGEWTVRLNYIGIAATLFFLTTLMILGFNCLVGTPFLRLETVKP